MTTKLYKGVHFGQMKAGRMKIEVKDGPGPGQYDPVTEQKPAADVMNIDKTRFESKIPRYLEQIVQNEEKMVCRISFEIFHELHLFMIKFHRSG